MEQQQAERRLCTESAPPSLPRVFLGGKSGTENGGFRYVCKECLEKMPRDQFSKTQLLESYKKNTNVIRSKNW